MSFVFLSQDLYYFLTLLLGILCHRKRKRVYTKVNKGGIEMTNVITTENLTKRYKQQAALNQVNMQIHQGDVYGLIGRNGAGKTTLMKMICRQIRPTAGKIRIQGQDVTTKDDSQLRIGTLIEAPGFYPDLTAKQNLDLKCQLYGIRRPGYIEELLQLVNLSEAKNLKKKTKKFSLGMKQRLGLALALVGDPDILLLDEPTNGMDPQGIIEFRQTILKLNRERNITVMISSHILGELSKFINRIGIINEGNLVKEADMKEINDLNRDYIRINSQNLAELVSHLEESLQISQMKQVDAQEIRIYEHLDNPALITHELIKAGILFDQLVVEKSSLEDYYINLTGGSANA